MRVSCPNILKSRNGGMLSFSVGTYLDFLLAIPEQTTVIMFIFGVVCIEVWHTEMPVWAFILALVSCLAYIQSSICSNAPFSRLVHLLLLHPPDRYDSGYHQPASRFECHYGAHHRLCTTR